MKGKIMIKASLSRNIMELSGNDMDFIPEYLMLTWELKNALPKELHGRLREAFDGAMKAKERPKMMCEEDFTRQMREMLGAKNEPKEVMPLDTEDIEFLLEKVHAAQQAGNCVLFRNGNYSVNVLAMEGEIAERKGWEKEFEMPLGYGFEDARREYDKCITYLKELAGKNHDN